MNLDEQPKTGKEKQMAERFYKELLDFLLQKKLPFMIGGTYALTYYTGIERPTKDIDIVTTEKDYPNILKILSEGGFQTKLHEVEINWLAKVYKGSYFTDIMYAERNGLHTVDETWLEHAKEGIILGRKVKLIPVEDLIRSKAYIQNRDRNDSADVIHLILKQGRNVNWKLLFDKMEPHWEILTSFLFQFLFIYPSERKVIPEWVIEKLMEKAKDRLSHPPTKNKITRGLLLSPDYEVGVSHFGFKPIRTLK